MILTSVIAGVIAIIQVELKRLGFTFYTDYFVFILSAMLICLPIMITGRGYPSLLHQLYGYLRSKRATKTIRN